MAVVGSRQRRTRRRYHPLRSSPSSHRTSARHAEEAEAAARAAGPTRVRLGNRHLLSRED
jgi:pyruvate-formate lyase-activating enzyme